jgi:ABC-2 type transport system permease protein
MSIFEMSVRGLLLRRRTAALALLPVVIGVLAIALLRLANKEEYSDAYGTMSGNLFVTIVVGIVGLVIGGNAFADEREGGTLRLLLTTATPRWRIVLSKLAAASLSTWLVCLPAVIGCAVLGASADGLPTGKTVGSLLLASVLVAVAYCGLFGALSLVSTHGLLIGLTYIVVWEGAIAGFTKALRGLSVGAYGRRLVGEPFGALKPFETADTGFAVAGVVLAVVCLAGFAFAAWRLPRMDVA